MMFKDFLNFCEKWGITDYASVTKVIKDREDKYKVYKQEVEDKITSFFTDLPFINTYTFTFDENNKKIVITFFDELEKFYFHVNLLFQKKTKKIKIQMVNNLPYLVGTQINQIAQSYFKFSKDLQKDISSLKKMSFKEIEKVYFENNSLNGISDEDIFNLKNIQKIFYRLDKDIFCIKNFLEKYNLKEYTDLQNLCDNILVKEEEIYQDLERQYVSILLEEIEKILKRKGYTSIEENYGNDTLNLFDTETGGEAVFKLNFLFGFTKINITYFRINSNYNIENINLEKVEKTYNNIKDIIETYNKDENIQNAFLKEDSPYSIVYKEYEDIKKEMKFIYKIKDIFALLR